MLVEKGSSRSGAVFAEWGAWRILAAAMVCYCCATMPVTAIGALVRPLGAEFGWSRASITSVFLITGLGTMFLAPVVGQFVDRIGARRVALVGLPLLAAGIALLGFAGPSILSWYLCWAVFAILQATAGNVIWTNVVVSHFDKHRGKALAVLLSAHAATYAAIPAFAVFTVSVLSWRYVFFFLAIFVALIAWPLCWRFVYSARDLERQSPTAPTQAAAATTPRQQISLLDVMRLRQFWQVGGAFWLAALVVSGLFVHLQPVLIDRGLTPMQAAGVALILGPASLIGRLAGGFVLDYLPPHWIAAIAQILPGISYAILMLAGDSMGGVYAAALFIGIAGGAESDLMAYLVSRYFGKASFSSTYGLLLGLYALGYGIGPIAAGRVFDTVGSYEPIFIIALAGAAIGAALIFALGPPRESDGTDGSGGGIHTRS